MKFHERHHVIAGVCTVFLLKLANHLRHPPKALCVIDCMYKKSLKIHRPKNNQANDGPGKEVLKKCLYQG